MKMKLIGAEEVNKALTWPALVEAMRAAHRLTEPAVKDMHLGSGTGNLLVRSAWFPGRMLGVKAVTVFADNPRATPPRPAVQGSFILFDGDSGAPVAVIDGAAITAWKTAADSALGADLLARQDARVLLMIGAGAMAEPLIRAHLSVRPYSTVLVWNRSREGAEALAGRLATLPAEVKVCSDLRAAMAQADVISSATMAQTPFIPGDALPEGCHLDLVGAYRPDMREADDTALQRSRLFVDCRDTTVAEIGELLIPIRNGLITAGDVAGDLFDLVAGRAGRGADTEITLYKNGGGAHLDLITAQLIHDLLDGVPG